MSANHDFLCYLKRGFGRATIQASQGIRDLEISRDQAIWLVEKYERMKLWHKEDSLKHKKLDWKATLMNWLREDIKSKKIQKVIKPIEMPVVEKISEEQRQLNLKKIQDIKNGKKSFKGKTV